MAYSDSTFQSELVSLQRRVAQRESEDLAAKRGLNQFLARWWRRARSDGHRLTLRSIAALLESPDKSGLNFTETIELVRSDGAGADFAVAPWSSESAELLLATMEAADPVPLQSSLNEYRQFESLLWRALQTIHEILQSATRQLDLEDLRIAQVAAKTSDVRPRTVNRELLCEDLDAIDRWATSLQAAAQHVIGRNDEVRDYLLLDSAANAAAEIAGGTQQTFARESDRAKNLRELRDVVTSVESMIIKIEELINAQDAVRPAQT